MRFAPCAEGFVDAILFESGLVFAVATSFFAGDPPKSGPPVGEPPAAFQVWDVTGPNAGRSLCYRCEYGAEPVVCVLTRNMDAPVTKLVEKIDAKIAQNSVLKSYMVLLAANDSTNEQLLKTSAKTRDITHVPLTILGKTEGPQGYEIASDAEITVVLWGGGQVRAVHAFAPGDLTDEKIKTVMEDLPKILR